MGRIAKRKGNFKQNRRKIFLQRHVDQIKEEIERKGVFQAITEHTAVDLELPGLGQYYCLPCDRYFVSNDALNSHYKTKAHKRRLKDLQETPYSLREAEAAGGLSAPDNGRPLRTNHV
ncbi:Zinc finger protein bud20 [Galdieria sulphuraria]|uniref:Zinc finger (C2H2 type) family protein n=1 Tax=Galdieria sulphuraria TaxID=130081 RepID=M2X1E9_GALSU|nr:zinc finger (C2H2 type) family protein [Galdieria sulphuraria]EME30190.1 zinc finger (C2H2 type) family protein [Galdieria sulphuraria]GJD11654.1 Zinc finger protein bud20 [Galdieria sulphuraria]|eukprot:XP_005706710.1 zinc finger (C2H2 type) family protein [Galdieria sulphuraria]